MGPELTSISTFLSYNIKTKKERKRKRITFEFELMDERNAKWIDTKYHNCSSPMVYLYLRQNLLIALEILASPHEQHKKKIPRKDKNRLTPFL